jgi:GAF domain-containing protein
MKDRKAGRYARIQGQLRELFVENEDLYARMATINALLYHKMDDFFWVGFYLLRERRLTVGPYQGPLACMELPEGTGVCWAGINQKRVIVVPDVHAFPGHIACDSRSRSEIVVPVINKSGTVLGVLDIDSRLRENFDETDAGELEKIVTLLFK